ncbi:hypothetical protein NMG60_11003609 [Bertholletia excelsa]
MDWAVWDQTHDEVALESNYIGHGWKCIGFGCGLGNFDFTEENGLNEQSFVNQGLKFVQGSHYTEQGWNFDFDFSCGFDLMEENALNEKSCIQALRVLIDKADTDILELEEDLLNLQTQLAWADQSWSETFDAALREKTDLLNISIQRLKNMLQDDNHFADNAPFIGDPAEHMLDIVKPLLKNYFPLNNKQQECFIIKDASGLTADDSNKKKELTKSDAEVNGKDGLRKQNVASEDRGEVLDVLWKSLRKERSNPRKFKPASASSSSDASASITGAKGKGMCSRTDSKLGQEEVQEHSSTDQIVILKSNLKQELSESNISTTDEAADDQVRSSALQEVIEARNGNPKLRKSLPSAPTSKKDPLPPSQLTIDKKRWQDPGGESDIESGLNETKQNESDSLLEFLNHKREQITKKQKKEEQSRVSILAADDYESNSNSGLKLQKQLEKKKHQLKQKAKPDSHYNGAKFSSQDGTLRSASASQKKRKCQSSPQLEKAKKLKGLQISLGDFSAGATENTSFEDICIAKCSFMDDPENGTPNLLSSPKLLPPSAFHFDLKYLSLIELRDIARQNKVKGYSKLTKQKLAEKISSKLMVTGGCT